MLQRLFCSVEVFQFEERRPPHNPIFLYFGADIKNREYKNVTHPGYLKIVVTIHKGSDSSAPMALRKPFGVDGVGLAAPGRQSHPVHTKPGRATAGGEET